VRYIKYNLTVYGYTNF